MNRLLNNIEQIVNKLEKRSRYGTVPSREYVPAGQKPIAMRCPAGSHSHAGFGYCHPEQRKHRVAAQQFHQEDARLKALERKMKAIGDQMYAMAKRKKVVPQGMKADFARIYRYLQRVKGTRRKLPINQGR